LRGVNGPASLGTLGGAQAVGREWVEKRIDVISMAIQKKSTVFDLEEAEVCYSPQFGAARDPINVAGMIAGNVVRGDASIIQWEDIKKNGVFILDVREPLEFRAGHIHGVVNIPLSRLRDRIKELPKDREIWTILCCGTKIVLCRQGTGPVWIKCKES
jgi:hypothetical protein